MIIKERKKPFFLRQLLVLEPRTPCDHPQYPLVKDYIQRHTAGYKGETSIDYFLNLLPEKDYYFFHDLRLSFQSSYFQMDTLLLSKKFALIIEVKNISGSLYFDPMFHQLVRTKEGVDTVFSDPMLQANRHKDQLRKWASANKLTNIPIYSVVVISNPQTFIHTSPENHQLHQKVIHREFIPTKINELEKCNQKVMLQEKELKKWIRTLKNQETPNKDSILERLQIKERELIKGVRCTTCNFIPLTRVHGTWYCPKCDKTCRDAHLQALQDYYLLFGPYITSSKLRDFLKISSPFVAARILKSLHLASKGTKRWKVYKDMV
ncbi:nuclease-related domain-containing protein [Niallia sp. 03133]|uniref:nuclease-related domain-containing protein n=1 Tax=Niallia sp. 03133 TaxID=3458060 RepID=UPI004044D0D3